MKKKESISRKQFVKNLGLGTIALAATPSIVKGAQVNTVAMTKAYPNQNSNLQIALIGAGGMGSADTDTALRHKGVKLVAVCDLYDGRLKKAKERWGDHLFTTKDYREIINRDDIDAVIVGTPDHWHKQISVDAMMAGKHVYCEKPMVHSVDEGPAVIAAHKKSGMVFQVGSQGMSSLGNEKAKELLAQGAIGDLNYAEGFWARRSSTGAWQYDIPADASPETVDWDTYISNTNQRDFDATRFFRWRNYRDYGTGMSGDLFVHLFSSLHFITGSMGPDKIYASGGLRYWKDGREVPDVLLGTFDYPNSNEHPGFNLSLRCNFVDGTSGTTYLRLVGSEGSMDVQWDKVILKRNTQVDDNDPFLKEKASSGASSGDRASIKIQPEVIYAADGDWKGAHYDHFYNWFNAIRGGKAVSEDAVFGYRAAAPALLCNDSFFQDEAILWDPVKMKRRK